MARSFNYTKRREITKSSVRVSVSPTDPRHCFAAAFDLAPYDFDSSAKVYVEAYRKNQLLRFDFDAARLGEALSAVAASKAQPELQVRFTVREPEKLEAELLRSAAENAKARAEILCAAAGKTLGELQRIDYDLSRLSFQSETMMDLAECAMPQMANGAMKAKRSFGAALRPQDIDLRDSAVFVWEIL